MIQLYELPRDKNIKIYGYKQYTLDNKGDDIVIIFGHIDGMYSYCWIENTDKLVQLPATLKLKKYKDGYKPARNQE